MPSNSSNKTKLSSNTVLIVSIILLAIVAWVAYTYMKTNKVDQSTDEKFKDWKDNKILYGLFIALLVIYAIVRILQLAGYL